MAKFMAALTHAFRGRLNAVLGSLELLSQTRLNEEQTRFAQTAVDEGRGLLQLVNDAFDLARLDAGAFQLEDVPLNPVAIAEGALDTVAARLHQHQIAVACRMDPQTPLGLRGDAARLRQILVNLLDNARKATESGSVVLTVRSLPAEQSGYERLVFEVADTGPGVPEALREHLFAPLVPPGRDVDWRSTSLGIGLALCRRLVQLMHGRIEFAPRPGGGSVFRFGVRLRRDVECERFQDVFAEARGRRVLLVDGEAVRADAVQTQLESCGIATWVAADGADAEAQLAATQTPFDLLLVHQTVADAARALTAASSCRRAVMVPIGATPQLTLDASGQVLWLSSPLRRRALLAVLLGRTPQGIDAPELFHAAHHKASRVLVVEDSDANRMVMCARLDRLGCTVDAVETGSEALSRLSQHRYALVLADLCLPDMSGLELAREVRQLGGEPGRVPIVAVSGGTHPRDRERCLAAGMNEYLGKPLEQAALIGVLRRFVQPAGTMSEAWTPDAITSMIRDLGRERIVDLLDAFERELGQRLARLGPEAPLAQIAQEVHALKSTALAFGATELGEAAKALETLCRQQDQPAARSAASALRLLGARVQAAVQIWVDRQREGRHE